MSVKIKKDEIIPIILLTLAFMSTVSATHINLLVGYFAMLCMSGWGIVKFVTKRKDKRFVKISRTIVCGNLYNKAIIHVYSIMLIVLELTENRFFSSNLQTYINSVSALCIFYLFKEQSLKFAVKALLLSFIMAIIFQIGSGNIAVHDISFGAEYILIYIFVVLGKLNKKNMKWVLLSIAILFVSYKSIQVLGFAAVVLLYTITKNLKSNTRKQILNIVSICFFAVIFLYVYLVIDGRFFDFITKYQISTSGRYYYYKVVHDFAEFSPHFLGLGRNAIQVLMNSEYSYMHVGNIHSDVLRMYCECGFIVFAFWLINYFVLFPNLIRKRYGIEARNGYLFLTYFTFISYMTDNIELYLVSQFFYMLTVIFTCLYKGKVWEHTGFEFKDKGV